MKTPPKKSDFIRSPGNPVRSTDYESLYSTKAKPQERKFRIIPRILEDEILLLIIFLRVVLTCRFAHATDILGFIRITANSVLLGRKPTYFPTARQDSLVMYHGLWYFCRALSDDWYHAQPAYEKAIKQILINTLDDGDVFVDVGANIGSYVLDASKKVGSRGLVVAIEPIPENVRVLKRNVAMNDRRNVIVIPSAAHSHINNLTMYFNRFHSGGSSAMPVAGSQGIPVTVLGAPIDMLLEPVLRSHSCIKAMKIDVEGAEDLVISGALRTLERTRLLVVEVEPHEHFPKLHRQLSSMGFVCKRVELNHRPHFVCWRRVSPTQKNSQQPCDR